MVGVFGNRFCEVRGPVIILSKLDAEFALFSFLWKVKESYGVFGRDGVYCGVMGAYPEIHRTDACLVLQL